MASLAVIESSNIPTLNQIDDISEKLKELKINTPLDQSKKVYRFKFSSDFQSLLMTFANKHRFDDPDLFRENWDEWVIENNNEIEKESRLLVQMGCQKNIYDKMYRSVRYYFKNKPIQKKNPKKRRKYVHFDKKFLKDMDIHIMEIAFRQDFKPEFAFNNFISDNTYSSLLDNEKERLLAEDWEEANIDSKIKKTYKNRYFIQQKKFKVN